MLEQIAFFGVSLITIFSFYMSYKSIINEKIDFSTKFIITLILGSALTTLFSFLGNSFIKNVFTIVFFNTIFYYKSKKNLTEAFYYSVVLWTYGIAIDIFTMIIVSILGFAASFELIYVRILASIGMAVTLFLICSIPFVKRFTNKTIEKILKLKPALIIDFIVILVLIFSSIICFININKISITLFSLFIALIIIIFMYLILSKNYITKTLKDVNNILIQNNEFYIKLDTDYRILKHNLTNQLLGIKSVSNKESQKLINDLITNYNSNFVVPKDINNIPSGINGIIYEKFYTYDKKDINLKVDNFIDSKLIDILSSRSFNLLCEILGVMIDNALEAASNSEDKVIMLDFFEQKDYIVINVINSFHDEINIDNIGIQGYSTKGRNRGIGLFSLLKRRNVHISNRIVNNLFYSQIKIKKVIY